MMTSFYNLLKYAATGQASHDMTYYDKLRASTLMGGTVQSLTGQPPLSFKADGTPLISWSMKGNGSQSGTPTPDNPVMPTFCGKLVGTDWTIPITCAGQTVPVYLGQVSTVRRIRKVRLGDMSWGEVDVSGVTLFRTSGTTPRPYGAGDTTLYCDRYKPVESRTQAASEDYTIAPYNATSSNRMCVHDSRYQTAEAWIADNGDALLWYILSEPTTGIVNEPLCKIGDYCDELHSTDAGVSIPTVKGSNTLTVDTELQPSEMAVTYRG